MLKKIIACAAFAAAMTCTAAFAAEYDGYIVEIADDTPARVELASAEGTGAQKIADNMYRVDTLDEAENFVDGQYIVNICPDFEFELHDDVEYFAPPNDTYFDQQWGLKKTNVPYAWKAGLNGEGVKIAVIDSGIDAAHEDFEGMNITDVYNMCDGSNPDDVKDNYHHGTAVAGIIAAQRNNGMGVAGIADKAGIAVIKVTNLQNDGFHLSTVIEAVDKAVEFKCDIVNMSIGSTGDISENEKQEMKEMIDSVAGKSVEKNGKELIMIASVGNNGTDSVSYPAGFDNVIGVASVDESYSRSSFSQHNESVFMAAPGSDIVVTVPEYIQTTEKTETSSGFNKYILGEGTSYSAPFISATAALAVQAANKAGEKITIEKMKDIFKRSVDDLGTAGWDADFGWGVINMKKLVGVLHDDYGTELPNPDPTPTPEVEPTPMPAGKLSPATTLTENSVKTVITNTAGTFENIRMIAALYDNEGNLVKIKMSDDTVLGETTEIVLDTSDVDRRVKEYDTTYKLFLWHMDQGGGIAPLTTASPINIPAWYTPSPTETPAPEETGSPEPGPETTTEPGPEVTTEPGPEVTTEPGPEVTTEPGPEITTEPVPETTIEPVPETTTEPGPETTIEPGPETTTEPEPETTIEPAQPSSGARVQTPVKNSSVFSSILRFFGINV